MVEVGHKEQILSKTKERMTQKGLHPLCIQTFLYYQAQLFEGASGYITEAEIDPLDEVVSYDELESYRERGIALMKHVALVKLNGGLGTSMGLDKAKSLLPARGSESFLDRVIRQLIDVRREYGVGLPLICMNSFRTDADTRAVIESHPEFVAGQGDIPYSFLQNMVPKLLVESLEPAYCEEDPEAAWCPPGHGDIYSAMVQTGILDALLEQDYTYAYFSNIDNLGAVFDPAFPAYMQETDCAFVMEVARRTAADKKGGHLARSADGRLLLREKAQIAPGEEEAFQNIDRYRYFNTNSLWIHVPSLKQLLDDTDGIPGLPLIRNKKTLNPRDPESPEVYQLETAMGTAISCFEHAGVVVVPRTRFAPVKTTNDLLDLWSDNFIDTDSGALLPNPDKVDQKIVITLDDRYYKKIDDFQKRFPHGAPSLKACHSLQVDGDVTFGKNVRLEGAVHIRNTSDSAVQIPDDSELSGTIDLTQGS